MRWVIWDFTHLEKDHVPLKNCCNLGRMACSSNLVYLAMDCFMNNPFCPFTLELNTPDEEPNE